MAAPSRCPWARTASLGQERQNPRRGGPRCADCFGSGPTAEPEEKSSRGLDLGFSIEEES